MNSYFLIVRNTYVGTLSKNKSAPSINEVNNHRLAPPILLDHVALKRQWFIHCQTLRNNYCIFVLGRGSGSPYSNSWEVLSNLHHSYWSLDMFYMLMTFTKPNKHLNVNPINSWTVILIYVQISILNPISRLYSWVLPGDKYQKPLRVGVMLRNATHAPYPSMVSDKIIPTKVETLF